jgi:PAS domain S-box-containing protein
MHCAASPSASSRWLVQNGPAELESLLSAVVSHLSAPVLVVDDDRSCRVASAGAVRLLGIPGETIMGRDLDEFAEPGPGPRLSRNWPAFLTGGEQEGALRLRDREKSAQDVHYTAIANLLPARHLLLLNAHRNSHEEKSWEKAGHDETRRIPSWVRDYAFFLRDAEGRLAMWFRGAERIFGYTADEVMDRNLSFVYPADVHSSGALPIGQQQLNRAAAEGQCAHEGWHVRKDGSRFWANTITRALQSADKELQGFAVVVRDFSDRYEQDARLRRSRANLPLLPLQSKIAGIVSGEFGGLPEANDSFLDLVGYSREDLLSGRLLWPELTPPEYVALDELAHEEGLRFGASAPFEKELIRKDGTRVPVLVVAAVLSPSRWVAFVQDLRERNREENVAQLAEPGAKVSDFSEIVGSSAAVQRILEQVEVVAPTDANVLILGETGTGKELVARAIHRLSDRQHQPFITLNCAAIPTGLLESELFGYERGAFTGALMQKIGRFELAHRGTLFLDEVGDIPLELQPKLLRALQEKSFERLGGTRTIPIDIRLVAATNRNLTRMMVDRLFRSDLYYRLKVFPLTMPPLRDHPEDIPLLARHFTQKYADKMNRQIDKIPAETMRALVSWSWPGNVRELENFIERSVILSRGPSLRAPIAELTTEAVGAVGSALEEVERNHILRILRETEGVVSAAAIRLGVPRTTLNAMMKKLSISRADL